MKAVVSEAFGGPEVLHLRELPDPPPPGPSEAQVKFVHSSSPGLARAGLAFHMSEVAREADIRGHDKSDANDLKRTCWLLSAMPSTHPRWTRAPRHDTAFDCMIDCSRCQRGQSFSQRTAR